MATDGEPQQPDEAEMLPDEAAVLPERGELLDETNEEELLTVAQAAEELGLDVE